jgi:N-acetylglutamate synthase-like GNAT family acetyltransferase
MELLRIRNAEKKDIPGILSISKIQLGKNYLNENNALDDIVVVAEKNSEIVAFAIASFQDNQGYLQSIATHPNHLNNGYATKLTKYRIQHLKEKGAESISAHGWKSPDGCHVGRVLEQCGFKPICEILNWYSDYTDCPYCQPNQCSCSAIFYYIAF